MLKILSKYFYSILFIFLAITASHGQSLVKKGTYRLDSILNLLAKDYNLTYSLERLPEETEIKIKDNLSIQSIFKEIGQQAGIKITKKNNHYILVHANPEIEKQTIRGYVNDISSGEALIGALITVPEKNLGVVTNEYGYFSLPLKQGEYIITCSYIGYIQDSLKISLNNDLRHHFNLKLKPSELEEITISSKPPEYNLTSIVPGVNTLELKTDGQIPYFLGEVDVLQGAILMPGIRTIGEDASGINVRGGGVDQNLLLLDEAVVYNPNHFYGLISVFNPEAVNSIEIMKGFMPPSYGGRASSVITVNQKEGNIEEFHLTGGVGLVSARLIAEGPIRKKKSSFILSARQSITDLSVLGNSSSGLTKNAANFQDINLKTNWRINPNNKVFLSGYFGNDRNRTGLEAIRNWGNRNLSFRWNHLYSPRLFSNVTAIVSDYNYKISDPQEAGSFVGKSNIVNYTVKSDFSYTLSPEHEFTFGLGTIFYRLKPGERIPFDENSSSNPIILDKEHAFESHAYIGHQLKMGAISALYGLRYSSLLNLGPGEVFSYTPNEPKDIETIVDTITHRKGDIIKQYHGLEPRLSLNFQLDATKSIKTSYTRTYQYLHLISNTVIPSPTDIWKVSDSYIPPTRSDHYSLGYYQNFFDNSWESSVEVYYKYLDNIIEYKNGADLLFNPNIETELLTGIGRSYGLEFFLKRNAGKLTGWISYTLSRSEIKVSETLSEDALNFGNYFPTDHDKLHDLSIVGIWDISKRWSASLSFNYSSGRPITIPVGTYEFEGNLVPHFQGRNQNNLPDYHRLDLSVKWEGRKIKKNGQPKKIIDYWTFVLYNVYGRKNAYSLIFRKSQENPALTEAIPFTIFDTPIPAITYNFTF